jgi:ABC-2 type transport system permease protein
LTGRLPPAEAFLYLVPFGIWAMFVVHALYVVTGLLAFWVHDVSPIFWVWQKVLFTLGGLMMPLALYPEWMQRLASATPFPSLLAGPAGFVLDGGAADAPALASTLACWSVVVVSGAQLLFWKAIRTLQVNGG